IQAIVLPPGALPPPGAGEGPVPPLFGFGQQTNTATISTVDQFDTNPGNDTASATEVPQAADLAVRKTVSNPTPNVRDTFTFTVTLTNNGPDTATGVQVTDVLPANLALLQALPSQGTYNPGTGLWTVGTVDTSAPRTLILRVRLLAAGQVVN